MIEYQTIREGIASAIMAAFDSWPIDDEQSFHLDGPAFLVRLADNAHILDDERHVRRQMDFNVAYLAPLGTPTSQVIDVGLRLQAALQPTISFGGRVITVYDVSGQPIEDEYQVDFRLDFYDELRAAKPVAKMQHLEFRIELKE